MPSAALRWMTLPGHSPGLKGTTSPGVPAGAAPRMTTQAEASGRQKTAASSARTSGSARKP